MVCSGGKDICLWDRNGRLLSKYDRNQLEETSKWERGVEGLLLSKVMVSFVEVFDYNSLTPPCPLPPGHVHSVLKLDSRHFGIVAASEYKSLGETMNAMILWADVKMKL